MWGPASFSTVKVIFTSGESADEKIKEIVSQAQNKKQIVVVTDDRAIQYYVRSLGAAVMSVADFLAKFNSPYGKVKMALESLGPVESTKGIPKALEYQITAELARLWLKPKEKHKE